MAGELIRRLKEARDGIQIANAIGTDAAMLPAINALLRVAKEAEAALSQHPAPAGRGDAVAFETWMDREWPLWRNDPDRPHVALLRRAWAASKTAPVADAEALADAELFRIIEKHVTAWHVDGADVALPRFIFRPQFRLPDGGIGTLTVTGRDGVGTCTLRTAMKIIAENASRLTGAPGHD